MNLFEIKRTLLAANSHMFLERQDVSRAGSTAWRFVNLNRVRKALVEIEETNLFSDIVKRALSSDILTSAGDETIADPVYGRKVEELLVQLNELITQFLITIEPLVREIRPNSIVITLPKVLDFDQLSEVAHSLQLAIGQVVINNEIQGKVEITSVENGSIVFTVDLGSLQALSIIGTLVTVALTIHYRLLSNRALDAKARIAKIDADRHGKLFEREQEFIDLYAEIEIDQIKKQYAVKQEFDYSSRLKKSILLFRELQEKGTEIKPAIDAPEKAKQEFPTKALIDSVGQLVHLLENQKLISDSNTPNSVKGYVDSDVTPEQGDGSNLI
jgi:hypothetical protein